MIEPRFITVLTRHSDYVAAFKTEPPREMVAGIMSDGHLVAKFCMSPRAAELFCKQIAEKLGISPEDDKQIAVYEMWGGGFMRPCDWIKEVDNGLELCESLL